MKYEWRKQDKKLYIPKQTPEIITLDEYTYIEIEGEGNPNGALFQECVEALYALSYGVKMAPKKGVDIPGYFEYTVFPLEGLWNLNDEGVILYNKGKSIIELKDYLVFKVMIRQPDFVSQELFNQIKETTFKKKKNDMILKASLSHSVKQTVCQCLHVGSYDSEPETFAKMEEFTIEEGYNRLYKSHIEVYLSDPRKSDPTKLKTTLRFVVSK